MTYWSSYPTTGWQDPHFWGRNSLVEYYRPFQFRSFVFLFWVLSHFLCAWSASSTVSFLSWLFSILAYGCLFISSCPLWSAAWVLVLLFANALTNRILLSIVSLIEFVLPLYVICPVPSLYFLVSSCTTRAGQVSPTCALFWPLITIWMNAN